MTTTAEPTETVNPDDLTTPEATKAVEATSLVPVMSWPTGKELADLVTLINLIESATVLPKALRELRDRRPDLALIMLAGRELRIGPMTAIRHIAIVEGKPSQSAELMAALALREGHKLKLVESNADMAEVRGQRKGEDDWTHMKFTLAQATKAGVIKDKSGWQRYPEAMLRARAVSALCRVMFADVLLGVSYTPEELGADVNERGEIIDIVENPRTRSPREPQTEHPSNVDPTWLVPPDLAQTFDHNQEHAAAKFLLLGIRVSGLYDDPSWGDDHIRNVTARLFNEMTAAGLWPKAALVAAMAKHGAPVANNQVCWWTDVADLRAFGVAAVAAAEVALGWSAAGWLVAQESGLHESEMSSDASVAEPAPSTEALAGSDEPAGDPPGSGSSVDYPPGEEPFV